MVHGFFVWWFRMGLLDPMNDELKLENLWFYLVFCFGGNLTQSPAINGILTLIYHISISSYYVFLILYIMILLPTHFIIGLVWGNKDDMFPIFSWLNWLNLNQKRYIFWSSGSSCKSEGGFQNGNCALCSFRPPDFLIFFRPEKMGRRLIVHRGNDADRSEGWFPIFIQGIWTYWYKIRCYKKRYQRIYTVSFLSRVQHVRCGCVSCHPCELIASYMWTPAGWLHCHCLRLAPEISG